MELKVIVLCSKAYKYKKITVVLQSLFIDLELREVLARYHALIRTIIISWDNKLDVIGFIRGQRFYCEEHINASELHVVRAAYFKSAMAAREGRQGECKGVARKGGREL